MTPPIPPGADWQTVRKAAMRCQSCPLWRRATQTVFGEGPLKARVVFVGEQPGDKEDREGRPFVGPAGRLLDKALAAAGVDRSITYVTNAVKHFKYETEGKRRMHDRPNFNEVAACRPWLEAELDILRPQVIVALGRTAAVSLLNSPIKVTKDRGRIVESPFGRVLITVHPSSLLRRMKGPDKERDFDAFVQDLRKISPLLNQNTPVAVSLRS